jgi:ketosteroid isomerase-like protein
MAEAPEAKAVVEEVLTRQREIYAGGDLRRSRELLAEDIVWHVPGTSPIAGDYRVTDGRILAAIPVPS